MSRSAGRRHRGRRLLFAVLPFLLACAEAAPPVDRLSVPEGFTVELLTDRLPNARQLALGSDGTLFAGTREDGRVRALRDGRVYTLARGLAMPSGVAYRDGDLWIGATDTIFRLRGVDDRLADPPAPEVVTDALPSDRHHGWKHLEFGPDGALWVPVGAPCNVCDPEPPYASMLRMDPESGAYEVWARGIRNSVGFDFAPDTGVLWLSDNGRDLLGDDVPPEELNRAPEPGLHFGYPYVHAGEILDPEFGAGHDPSDYAGPALTLQAHTAPLGIAFYTGAGFPERYRGALFVAQHGSWNRSAKVGYRVIVAFLEDGRVTGTEPFLTGFLEGESAWGRPVDVLVHPDGSLLVSDDAQGAVYRIRWTGDVDTAR